MSSKSIQLSFKTKESMPLRDAIRNYGISKKALTSIKFEGGSILVNGEEKTVRHIVKEGDQVTINFPEEKKSEGLIPEKMNFPILFEDEHILIILKEAGISTIPSKEHPTGTVANGIAGYLEACKLPATVHIVTRLDKDTSGVICVAKHRHAHHLFSEMQKNDLIIKTYEALVHGHIAEDAFVIEAPIGRKSTSIIERLVTSEGKYARTSGHVLGRLTIGQEKFTHVSLTLHTGRTHQIRVHMAHIGHPLLGDDLYGGKLTIMNRQALHARKIEFIHPFTKQPLAITAEYSKDMNIILSKSTEQ